MSRRSPPDPSDSWRPEPAPARAADLGRAAPTEEQLEAGSPAGHAPGRARVAVRLGLLAAAVAVLVPLAVVRVHDWTTERRLGGLVRLDTAVGVSSSSSSPPGGRVDYYLSITNVGPRPVTVEQVEVAAPPSLRVVTRRSAKVRLGPEEVLLVPLSVALDCTRSEPGRVGEEFRVIVQATPRRAGRRSLDSVPRRASALPDVAQTLCQLDPGRRVPELSGPLLHQ